MSLIENFKRIDEEFQTKKKLEEEDQKKLDWDINNLAEKYNLSRRAFVHTILKNKIESIYDELEDDPYNLPSL